MKIRTTIILGICCVLVWALPVWGEYPYTTDDPDALGYRRWEFIFATQYRNEKGDLTGTLPFLEVNYGFLPDVTLHVIIPDQYNRPKDGPALFGIGNVELGVQYRIIHESDYVPMIGTFPHLELPTASKARGLGSGEYQLFLPLWLQKSWKSWRAYGGGGYWVNPGQGNKDYWYTGFVLQRAITKWLELGAEIFYQTRSSDEKPDETGYNVGALIHFSNNHHVAASLGADLNGPASSFFYAAYVFTWGLAGQTGFQIRKK